MKRVVMLCLVLAGVDSCVPDRPPCTPENCQGCCDEAEVCHPGAMVDFCGLGGRACVNCSPSVCKANGECFELQDFLDAGTPDASFFVYEADGAVAFDAGVGDGGSIDAGALDAGGPDAGRIDGGGVDAGDLDAGPSPDAGRPDAGAVDAGPGVDAGRPDAGPMMDGGRPDAGGGTDAGCPPVDRWVDPVNGADSNPGTQASPFQSLRRAASSTTCGTIWLGNGVYGPAEAPNPFNPVLVTGVVSVRALTPGQAVWGTGSTTAFSTLNVRTGTVLFEGFECHQPTCFNVQAMGPVSLTFRGVTFRRVFDSNWPTMVFISGSQGSTSAPVRASVEAGGAGNLCPPGALRNDRIDHWFRLSGDAHLTVSQAACEGFGSVMGVGPLFSVEDPAGRLVLDGVTLRGQSGYAFAFAPEFQASFLQLSRGQAQVRDSTLEALAGTTAMQGIVLGLEQNPASAPRLTLTNTIVRGLPSSLADGAHAVFLDRGLQGDQGQAFVTISGSLIERSRGGVLLRSGTGGGTVQLSITDTVFRELVDGAVRVANFTASTVTLSGLTADRAGTGVSIANASATHVVSLRDSTFTGNTARGVFVEGGPASSFDLGTVTSPGNNLFSADGGQPFHLVAGTGSLPTVFAVGNTWSPNTQGADGAGRYSAPGDGGVVDVVGPVMGQNVRAANVGTRVRVAESP